MQGIGDEGPYACWRSPPWWDRQQPTPTRAAPRRSRAISFANSPLRGDTYELGEKIKLMVRFNRSVALVETTLKLALIVGARARYAESYAIRVEDGVERDLYFSYTVRAGDRDADGISIPVNALSPQRGRHHARRPCRNGRRSEPPRVRSLLLERGRRLDSGGRSSSERQRSLGDEHRSVRPPSSVRMR